MPAWQDYLPLNPSPLGLYSYTAADIQEEATPTPNVQQTDPYQDFINRTDSSVSASPVTQTQVADGDEDDEPEESPRKRRRITTEDHEEGTGVALTIQYAPLPTLHSPLVGGESGSDRTSPLTPHAGWSFRAVDADTTMEDSVQGTDGQVNADHADEESMSAGLPEVVSPTPRLEAIDPDLSLASRRRTTVMAATSEPSTSPEITGRIDAAASATPAEQDATAPSEPLSTDNRSTNLNVVGPRRRSERRSSEPRTASDAERSNVSDEIPAQATDTAEEHSRMSRSVRVGTLRT